MSAIKTGWSTPQEMDEYLSPAGIVDTDSPVVLETTGRIIHGAETPKEAIRMIFHFVRDDIKYGRIDLYSKASDVIRRKMGNCTNKSVAMVAMLRAAGIPARLHYYSIKKEGVQSLLSPFALLFTPDVIPLNARTEVFLAGKWIILETELDPDLYRGLVRKNLMEPVDIDWDGEASTHAFDKYVVDDLGAYLSPEEPLDSMYASFDWLKRMLMPFAWWSSNRWLERIRRAGRI
jgi:hypothetical protein